MWEFWTHSFTVVALFRLSRNHSGQALYIYTYSEFVFSGAGALINNQQLKWGVEGGWMIVNELFPPCFFIVNCTWAFHLVFLHCVGSFCSPVCGHVTERALTFACYYWHGPVRKGGLDKERQFCIHTCEAGDGCVFIRVTYSTWLETAVYSYVWHTQRI